MPDKPKRNVVIYPGNYVAVMGNDGAVTEAGNLYTWYDYINKYFSPVWYQASENFPVQVKEISPDDVKKIVYGEEA